jgi:hypothetical protein
MKTNLTGWICALLLLVSGANLKAATAVLPKPGRYKGTVTIEFATTDKKSSVKQIMPAFAFLLNDNTLQVVMPQIPGVAPWKTRQPSGLVAIAGAPPMIPYRLRWDAVIGDVSYILNGPSTATTFTLAYDDDPAETGSSHLGRLYFTIKMSRVGNLP